MFSSSYQTKIEDLIEELDDDSKEAIIRKKKLYALLALEDPIKADNRLSKKQKRHALSTLFSGAFRAVHVLIKEQIRAPEEKDDQREELSFLEKTICEKCFENRATHTRCSIL